VIKVYDDPLLLDFLKLAINMPADERGQLEALTGQKYDIDGAAVGNFSVPGPKWVVKADDEPVCAGGLVLQRPGVWRDFMLTTPEAWAKYWFPITRVCRRIVVGALASGAHRVECITPATRLAARPEIEEWYRVVGYTREATLWRYCADGSDAVVFSRVRK
jgi:hypothetical protein